MILKLTDVGDACVVHLNEEVEEVEKTAEKPPWRNQQELCRSDGLPEKTSTDVRWEALALRII